MVDRHESSRPPWMGAGAVFTALAVLLGLLLVVTLVRTAWLCDDAFIIFRSVDNLWNGHGPRWNPAERVQTYTHPLWTFLVTVAYGVTREAYYTVMALSALLTAGAVALLAVALCRGAAALCLVLLTLTLSRAFVDFSTSGLENPVSNLLLVAYAAAWLAPAPPERRLWRLSVLALLQVINRMDTALLVLPALLVAAWPLPWRRSLRILVASFSPLLLWLLWTSFYYGSPWPSPFYAKALATGIPATDLAAQGLRYYQHLVLRDPVTAIAILAGLAAGLHRPRQLGPLALGVLLYLLYVVKIGGGFMMGRFFTAPLLLSLALLAYWRPGRHVMRGGAFAAIVVIAGLFNDSVTPTVLSGPDYRDDRLSADGIADERGFYYQYSGLLSPTRLTVEPGSLTAELRARGLDAPIVTVVPSIGAWGYRAGELVHVVDPWLCDPLLVRLPVEDPQQWRIGHFTRRIPEGYLESLATGENRIRHPGLHRYYEALRQVVRGDLLGGERLAALWQLWTGQHDAALARFVAEEYFAPPLLPIDATELASPLPEGTQWFFEPAVRLIREGGVEVRFPELQHAARLRLGLDTRDGYILEFRDGQALGRAEVVTRPLPFGGLQHHVVQVPETAARLGYRSLRILPGKSADGVWAVGFVQPLPE